MQQIFEKAQDKRTSEQKHRGVVARFFLGCYYVMFTSVRKKKQKKKKEKNARNCTTQEGIKKDKER